MKLSKNTTRNILLATIVIGVSIVIASFLCIAKLYPDATEDTIETIMKIHIFGILLPGTLLVVYPYTAYNVMNKMEEIEGDPELKRQFENGKRIMGFSKKEIRRFNSIAVPAILVPYLVIYAFIRLNPSEFIGANTALFMMLVIGMAIVPLSTGFLCRMLRRRIFANRMEMFKREHPNFDISKDDVEGEQ